MQNHFEYGALGAYKDELFRLFCDTENNPLCKLLIDILMPKLDDDRFDIIDNFLGGEYTYTNSKQSELVKLEGHLHDVPFVYATVTDTRNVICIDDNITRNNQSTKELSVTLYVMCHKNSLKLDSKTRKKYKKLGYIGRNRLDIAVALVGDIINHSDIKSIGKLQPTINNPTQSYFPNSEYFGKVLTYTTSDFMIDYSKELYHE